METIRLRGVRKSFRSTQALAALDLAIGPGVTGLLGPNGAGKTTLLRILATVLAADRGDVRILGLDPSRVADRTTIRRRIGYMPQEPGFHRGFTASEFVDYVAILKEMTQRSARRAEVRRVLGLVDLEDVAHKKIRALSGGMRRRVALAQALLGDPEVLLLDEPTAGLDPQQRLRFRDVISRIGERRTVLVSTHQTEDVAAVCQRVIVVHHGRAVFDGKPPDLARAAHGRVWASTERGVGARISWRSGDGTYRNIGDPPAGARLLEPTIEDAYLLLVGEEALRDAA